MIEKRGAAVFGTVPLKIENMLIANSRTPGNIHSMRKWDINVDVMQELLRRREPIPQSMAVSRECF
jgi:hypothetical protein